jgi:hypothetical protein
MKGKVIVSNKDFRFAAIASGDGDILIVEALDGDRFSIGNDVNTRGLGYADQGRMQNLSTGEEVEVLVQDVVSSMEEAISKCQGR